MICTDIPPLLWSRPPPENSSEKVVRSARTRRSYCVPGPNNIGITLPGDTHQVTGDYLDGLAQICHHGQLSNGTLLPH